MNKNIITKMAVIFVVAAVFFISGCAEEKQPEAIKASDVKAVKTPSNKAANKVYVPGSGFNPDISEETIKLTEKYKSPRISHVLAEIKKTGQPKTVEFDAVVYSVYKKKHAFQIMDIKTAIEASACCIQCVLDAAKLMVKVDKKIELPAKLAEIKIKGKVLKTDKGTYIMENTEGYTFIKQRTWADLQ